LAARLNAALGVSYRTTILIGSSSRRSTNQRAGERRKSSEEVRIKPAAEKALPARLRQQ
jgi:hypothetical protein